MNSKRTTAAPKHLKAATKRWWNQVVNDFEFESHHLKILVLACEAWDRCQQAREAIAKHGMTYTDRFNAPRSRPEISIERDARIAFARLTRELGLDVSDPPESRPPAMAGNAHLRNGNHHATR